MSAVDLALTRNERAKIADEQIAVADAAVRRSIASFLPTAVVNANDAAHPFNASANTASNTQTATGTVSQPILSASAWPLLRQAERLLDAQHATSTDAKRLLSFDAATAFMSTLSVEHVLEAAQKRVDTAKANLADAQARVEAQLVSSNDVTRAALDLASAQQELANDEGSVRRAYLNLGFVLATHVDGPLQPPEATMHAAALAVVPMDRLIAAGEARRLDLVASHHSARAAHLFAEEPLLRLIPTLGVSAAVVANSTAPNGKTTDETLTGTLTWTLYDAGIRYADKRTRDAQATIADLQEQTLVRSIENDVRLAVSALEASQGAYQAAAAAVDASRKSAGETATLYHQGLAKALELTDANDSRFVAEVGYASAELSMALAYLSLRQALGLDPLGTEMP
jgi:outer membrane protein TolC